MPFDVSFLQRVRGRDDILPFHLAQKKVPYVSADGSRIDPELPNATKFERFIFDLLPEADNATLVTVEPSEGFAPLKNASEAKTDTAQTARGAMVAQHSRWLTEAGAHVKVGCLVEINPRFALDAEEVAQKVTTGARVEEDTYFTE